MKKRFERLCESLKKTKHSFYYSIAITKYLGKKSK